ncbi:MAG TPA: cytochrome c oxidase subunit II [Phycisphaerales bacterium]|nr:cytochrome c oxidase subunit II [Phycisphaerales bacterium]
MMQPLVTSLLERPPMLDLSAMGRFWFRTGANSEVGRDTDALYMFILWVCLASFVLLMGLMVIFVVRYRRGGPGYQVSAAHNTPLELAWSIIPLLVMVVIFFWGFHGYVKKLASSPGSLEISVTGQRWNWLIQYPHGGTPRDFVPVGNVLESPVIYVPAGRPVKLVMQSTDVIHSFYIPAMRTKMDVFPNRYTSMTFTPENPGEHVVYCAEYCGDKHSEMAALVRVVDVEEFAAQYRRMVEVDPKAMPHERGEFYFKRYGCNACHTVSGLASTGPTWKNMFGYPRPMADGSEVVADENYIRESIYSPQAKVHRGFGPPSAMNSFQGIIDQPKLDDLIAFMKTLSDRGGTGTGGTGPQGTLIVPEESDAASGGRQPGATPGEHPAGESPPGAPGVRPVPGDQPQVQPGTQPRPQNQPTQPPGSRH